MSQVVSEALIERLADWGADTAFGLPGDGINGSWRPCAGKPSSSSAEVLD